MGEPSKKVGYRVLEIIKFAKGYCHAGWRTGDEMDSAYKRSGGTQLGATYWYREHLVAGATRLELATSGVTGQLQPKRKQSLVEKPSRFRSL